MKYKIGNVEVEAVQWNGENNNEIINLVLENNPETIDYSSERDFEDNYLIISRESLRKEYFLKIGYYMVSAGNSLFTLSEQDFNNMATKVKEPKFKVGDKVYFEGEYFISVNTIESVDGYSYRLEGCSGSLKESQLFTLEEAIEKLKEL
jgi:hypothetical protein